MVQTSCPPCDSSSGRVNVSVSHSLSFANFKGHYIKL